MKKAKIVMTSIALITAVFVLGFTACSDDPGGDGKSSNANLSLVTFAGATANLGTPASTFEGITNPGSVILLSGTNVLITAQAAHAKAAVDFDKFPFSGGTPDYWPAPPTSFGITGEALAIRVTAEDGTKKYYRINVTVASVALSGLTVGGENVALRTPAATWQDASPAAILFDYFVTEQPSGGITVAATPAEVTSTVKYGHATGTNTPDFTETNTITFVDGEYLYIEVSSAGGVKAYYKVAVNFKLESIIKYASPAIVNGVIDPLWDDPELQVYPIIKPYPIDCTEIFLERDPEVWTWGEGRALWDEDGLYIYVRVYDPDVSATLGEGSTAHLVDSVELFVNEAYPSTSYSAAGSQYRLGANGERSGEGNSPAAFIALNKTSAWKTDDGYIVIFQAPWRFKNQYPLADGRKIGFELQINACTDAARDGVMVWNNVAHTNYQNATDYGVATLDLGNNVLKLDAAEPVVTVQPVGGAYTLGETLAKLSVDAFVTDGGTLSYQWFRSTTINTAGTAVGTGLECQPAETAVGNYFYYAVITNNNPNAEGSQKTAVTASARARIQIFESGAVLVEEITLRQSGVVYQFRLADGETFNDYEKITAEYWMDADNAAKALRFHRMYGNFQIGDFVSAGDKTSVVFNSGNNNGTDYLYSQPAPNDNRAADTWFTAEYKLDGSEANSAWAPTKAKPNPTDTGPFYFSIGFAGNNGESMTQLIRNVTMVHKTDPSKNVVTRTSGLGGMAFAGYGGADGMNFNNRVWRTEDVAAPTDFVLTFDPPEKNETAAAGNYQSLVRIDLGEDFDITKYAKFTFELKYFDEDGDEITPANSLAQMKWRDTPTTICANGGGWRWDLGNIGNGLAVNTDAVIPAYLFKIGEEVTEAEVGGTGTTPYTVAPLRYLDFENANATVKFIEVYKITFFLSE